jgi:hypothetical protein
MVRRVRAADGSIQIFPDDMPEEAIRHAMLAYDNRDTWGALAGKVGQAINQRTEARGRPEIDRSMFQTAAYGGQPFAQPSPRRSGPSIKSAREFAGDQLEGFGEGFLDKVGPRIRRAEELLTGEPSAGGPLYPPPTRPPGGAGMLFGELLGNVIDLPWGLAGSILDADPKRPSGQFVNQVGNAFGSVADTVGNAALDGYGRIARPQRPKPKSAPRR